MLGYTVFVFVERYLALRKATKEDVGLLNNIKTHLANDNIQGAKDACEASDSPISVMLAKGISRIGSAKNESIAATIENTGKFEILRLEQRLNFLATAAGAAPMIGFLGTTIGMVVVFIDLQNSSALELKTIAPGIMTAMVTTVGVPFKKDVDTLKKRLVNRWKGERGRNLEKKVVRDQLNVTGVPNKLVAQYRDAATNYIMKNGPTMKQLENYKKTWINLRNKSQR